MLPANAPGPRGWRVLESLREIRRDRISFVERAAQEFGDIVDFRMGPKRLFLLRAPEMFRHVLVDSPERYGKGPGLDESRPFLGQGLLTSEGCQWREDRANLERSMQAGNLDFYAGVIDELTREFLDWVGERARRGEIVDASAAIALLTLRIVGRAFFGWDFGDAIAAEIAADLHTLNRWAMEQMMGLVAFPIWIRSGAGAALRRLRLRADEILRNVASGESCTPACEALSRMVESGGRLRARDHIITFLLAGHETTALTLSWAIGLLARNEPISAAVRAESRARQLGSRTWAGVQALDLTRQVIEETLRLYPPVWLLPRKSLEPDCLAGYRIPAGSGVLLCVYLLHRHGDFWKDAREFRPERFSRLNAGARPPGCYLPFGLGSRSCIGSRLGFMEALLILSALAARFRWEPAWTGDLRPNGSLSLQPAGGVPVRFMEA
jgi:cytochrome P450